MNLPPSLSQQTPLYRTQFYVEEASLYSIAENSREDLQSEITSRAGTVSTTSTPVSVKIDPPFSLRSSAGASALSDWEFDEDDWGGGNGSSFDNSLVNAAKGSRWIPPTAPSLDAEEMSNSASEATYPSTLENTMPTKRKGCSRNTFLYAALISLLLASIATIASIPLLRKRTSTTRSSVSDGLVGQSSFTSSPTLSPSLAPSPSPSRYPTPSPTFPIQISEKDQQSVYEELATCADNDMREVLQTESIQHQVFNQLVVEWGNNSTMGTEELLERWALMVLYLSADGELWGDGYLWFHDTDVCLWGSGTIVCDTRVDGRAAVTGLYLRTCVRLGMHQTFC